MIYFVFSFNIHFNIKFEEEINKFLTIFNKYLIFNNNNNNNLINIEIFILILITIILIYENNNNNNNLRNFIIKEEILQKIFKLKFNNEFKIDNFYCNNFKYSIMLQETIKNFFLKIFNENNINFNLFENVFKYAIANINTKNNEINLQDFINITSDYINLNNIIYFDVIKKLFLIIKKKTKLF